jgi:hypothetical protein
LRPSSLAAEPFGKAPCRKKEALFAAGNLETIPFSFPGREKDMKNFLAKFGKKLRRAQKEKNPLSYRLPDTVWMSDVKKASEWGALLPKKRTPKKAPAS